MSESKKSRTTYELDEVLTIIRMMSEDISLKQIAAITANSPEVKTRSVYGLRYKFKESMLTNHNKNEKYVRSLKQLTSNEEVFQHFDTPFVDGVDVEVRIANYRSKLIIPENVAVTA